MRIGGRHVRRVRNPTGPEPTSSVERHITTMTFELDRGGRFRDRAAGWALRTAFVAFTAAVAVTVAACGNAATSPTAAGELSGGGGMLRGEISRFIVDREDGTSEVQYFIRTAAGAERRLYFARDPDLAPYAPVEIRGRAAAGDAVTVSSFRLLDTATPTAETRGLVAPKPKTPRRFAFVLIDTGEGVNLSAETARERMFDAGHFVPNQGSIRRYYQEASFGVEDITGDVYGPIRFTPTVACDTRGVTTLRPQIDAMAGGPIDHYLWYFGSRQAGCNWSGLASLGSPDRPARDTWYNASSSCVVLVQEPGHNFGMQHSSSMTCPGGKSFVDEPEGACTHAEYGDSFDPMGGGCRHMNGWQKTYQGWFGRLQQRQGHVERHVHAASRSRRRCDGIQVLQIPMPQDAPLHRAGRRRRAPPSTCSPLLPRAAHAGRLRPAGARRRWCWCAWPATCAARKRSGLHTWLLDMTPSTSSFRDAALPVGETFTDPAGGVSITVVSANAAQASMAVHLAAETGPPDLPRRYAS